MATAAYHRALAELAPEGRVVDALEISHPNLTTPVRVVADTQPLALGGRTWQPVAFGVRLMADEDGAVAHAELAIDNVGRPLTRWIEATSGGAGATVRVMQVLVPDTGAARIEWEMIIGVVGVAVDQQRIVVRLGYEQILDRPAVALRYDLRHAPGLF